MRCWIMLDVLSLQSRVWRPKRKILAAVVTPVPTLKPCLLPPALTHLAAPPYMFIHLSKFPDTLSCIHTHAHISARLRMFGTHFTSLCTGQYTDRCSHANGCILGLGAGWRATWRSEGTTALLRVNVQVTKYARRGETEGAVSS